MRTWTFCKKSLTHLFCSSPRIQFRAHRPSSIVFSRISNSSKAVNITQSAKLRIPPRSPQTFRRQRSCGRQASSGSSPGDWKSRDREMINTTSGQQEKKTLPHSLHTLSNSLILIFNNYTKRFPIKEKKNKF